MFGQSIIVEMKVAHLYENINHNLNYNFQVEDKFNVELNKGSLGVRWTESFH